MSKRHNVFMRKPKRENLFFFRVKGKLQLLFALFCFVWAPTQTRLLPLEATTPNYTSTDLYLFKLQLESEDKCPPLLLPASLILWLQPEGCYSTLKNTVPPCNTLPLWFDLYYKILQTLTSPHCQWMCSISHIFILQSRLDSITALVFSLQMFWLYLCTFLCV